MIYSLKNHLIIIIYLSSYKLFIKMMDSTSALLNDKEYLNRLNISSKFRQILLFTYLTFGNHLKDFFSRKYTFINYQKNLNIFILVLVV